MSYVNYFAGQPISDGWAEHRARGSLGGIDYAVGVGTPIRATCDGRVENIPYNGSGGHTVTLWHTNGLGGGYRDQFMHCSRFVAEGNYKQGDIIGYSGGAAGSDGAGSSTGPHCHWHLITPGGTRVNPFDYLNGGSGSGSSSGSLTGGGSAAAWKNIQSSVAAPNGYTGPIDGIPGVNTWKAMQGFLRGYGYTGPIDGAPGPNTWKAMQRWLAASYGYTGVIDGIPGPLTAAAINRAGAGAASPTGGETPQAAIQRLLKSKGVYTGNVDGIFGPLSWTAVQKWLAGYGLYNGPIDGIPGPKTYAGFQQYGKKNGNYSGPLDGILGPKSWAGFAQTLTEDIGASAAAEAAAAKAAAEAAAKAAKEAADKEAKAKAAAEAAAKAAAEADKKAKADAEAKAKAAKAAAVQAEEDAKAKAEAEAAAKADAEHKAKLAEQTQDVFINIKNQGGSPVKNGIFAAVRDLQFWNDTLTRALNTFFQVALAAVGTGAVGVTDIDYIGILNLATGGALISVITSFVRATTPKSE